MRAIAIGTLVAHRDLQSADLMPKAAVGLENPIVACELIARLRRWNDVKAVPVLIEFLEDDGLSYIIGNDLGIPAVKSQETIRKITGYALPFDVAVSRDAWSQAKDISNREERIQLLRRILPNDPDPWNAVLLRNEKKYVIEVTNRSKQTISLLKQPSYIDVSYSHGVFTVGHDKGAKTGKARFEKLAPGGSIRFPVDFRNQDFEFLISSGKRQRIELQYLENGNEFGLKAWLGVVEVSVAKNIASAKTPTKEVTERWPNGNLKLKGQTLGRVKTGEWTYFNEAGDRTRTIEYFNGRIAKEATYNPSHPTNDGMGKKPESPQAREAEASILGSSAIKRTVISLLALLSIVALMTGALWYRRRRTAA